MLSRSTVLLLAGDEADSDPVDSRLPAPTISRSVLWTVCSHTRTITSCPALGPFRHHNSELPLTRPIPSGGCVRGKPRQVRGFDLLDTALHVSSLVIAFSCPPGATSAEAFTFFYLNEKSDRVFPDIHPPAVHSSKFPQSLGRTSGSTLPYLNRESGASVSPSYVSAGSPGLKSKGRVRVCIRRADRPFLLWTVMLQ